MAGGGLPLGLLVAALLCAAVSGGHLRHRQSPGGVGQTSTTGRTSPGLESFLDVVDSDSCKFHCNAQPSEGDACQGAFGGKCITSTIVSGINITMLSKFGCVGSFTGFETKEKGKRVEFGCSGLFVSKDLSIVPYEGVKYIQISHYSCILSFDYENEENDDGDVENTFCKGAEAWREATTNVTEPVDSLEDMETLLDEFVEDDDPTKFDISEYDTSVSAIRDDFELDVTCNGKESNITEPCDGEMVISAEGENFTMTEECDGKWFPLPLVNTTFSCSGNWSFDSDTTPLGIANVVVSASCEGRSVTGHGKREVDNRTYLESGQACIGEQSSTSTVTVIEGPPPSVQLEDITAVAR